MLERYGQDMTVDVRNQIRSQIQSGKSVFLRKKSNARTVHRVMINDKPIVVVWDKERSVVITVLPQAE